MATTVIPLPLEAFAEDASSPAERHVVNGETYFAFDDTTKQYISFGKLQVPTGFLSDPVLRVKFSMASDTTHDVIIGGAVWAVDADADTPDYDTENESAATAVAGTAGYEVEATITLTNFDSAGEGDDISIRISRATNNGNDDAVGDMELRSANLEFTI